MSDVIIRKAKLADKNDVMRIRDYVYAGRDYLLSFYETFMKADNCYPFVAVIDDEIVAFCAAFLVDNMKTLITRGARVSPKHGGKGVYKLLNATIKEKAKELGAIHYSFTSNSGNQSIQTDSFKKHNRHILTKEGLVYSINGGQWKPITDSRSWTPIPEAGASDFDLYISSDIYRKYLFPSDILIANWVPYRLIQSNLDIIQNENVCMILSDVKIENGRPKGMVSIATTFQCSAETYGCNLDIYGTDFTTFKQHLSQQLEHALSKMKGQMSFVIFLDSNMATDTVKRCAKEVGLEESTWTNKDDESICFNSLLLFETNL